MTTPAGARRGRSLLAIFAHPDDESLACGGLLARCADSGARVSLLCLTDGGNGPDAGGRARGAKRTRHSGEPREGLGQVRARELDAACRALGVTAVERLHYEDGMLPWMDHELVESGIRQTIERVRPDVVITFDEDGLYWHPDHVAVHERTTAVVAAAGSDAPALYYVTIPPGAMRAVVQCAEAAHDRSGLDRPARFHILGIADPDAFGADSPAPTVIVDVTAFASRKLAAIRCHRSQLRDDALDLLDGNDAARLLGVEHYRRASVGYSGETFVDHLTDVGRGSRSEPANNTPLP